MRWPAFPDLKQQKTTKKHLKVNDITNCKTPMRGFKSQANYLAERHHMRDQHRPVRLPAQQIVSEVHHSCCPSCNFFHLAA